jgi:hypothetical protein
MMCVFLAWTHNLKTNMKTIEINGEKYVLEKDIQKLPVIDIETAPFQIGKNYLIRTVTFIYTGKLVWVGEKELVFDNLCWIADTGRWMQAVQKGTFKEVEPMGDGKGIGRGSIVDFSVVDWELPTQQK